MKSKILSFISARWGAGHKEWSLCDTYEMSCVSFAVIDTFHYELLELGVYHTTYKDPLVKHRSKLLATSQSKLPTFIFRPTRDIECVTRIHDSLEQN